MPQAHTLRPLLAAVLLVTATILSGAPCAWGQPVATLLLGDLLAQRYVRNDGQWPAEVVYSAGLGPFRTWVGPDSICLQVQDPDTGRAATVSLRVSSPAGILAPRGEQPLPGVHHFLHGRDPGAWARNVSAYRAVVLEEAAGHRSLTIIPKPRGLVLELESHATSPCELLLDVEGAAVSSDDHGILQLEASLGRLRQYCPSCGPAPRNGCPHCHGGLRLFGSSRLRWAVARPPTADAAGPATIGLEWSTLLAGAARDAATGVAFASDGSVVVAGHTLSQDFPTTPGSFDPTHAPPHPQFFDNDLFVARLTSDASGLVYSTFLGGGVNDFCRGLLLQEDEAIVLGDINSADYPTTDGALLSQPPGGGGDVAVTRLSGDGSTLVFSTYLGGASGDFPRAFTRAAAGGIVVVGWTGSSDFPVTQGAFDTTLSGADGFVTMLSGDGKAVLASTFLGNAGTDIVQAVALLTNGSIAVAGEAGGPTFPTTAGVLQSTEGDSFVSLLSADGTTLLWSTFLGGAAGTTVNDLAADALGTLTIAGTVDSVPVLFPTTEGSFDPTYNGGSEGFVTRIDPSGTQLLTSTFIGGTNFDELSDVVLDASGVATVVGLTQSADFPATPGAYDTTHAPGVLEDLFVARLSPKSDRLFYGTYLGGTGKDPDQGVREIDVAVGPDGEVVIVSTTLSTDFPTTPGAFQPDDGPFGDATVSKLTMLPAGVQGLGHQTPGCASTMTIGVTAMPFLGNDAFGLWCSGAPPSSSFGLLGLSRRALSAPVQVLGIDLWIDPRPLALLAVKSDELGFSELPLPVPDVPALAGVDIWAQYFWVDACGTAGLAASRALGITFQP